MANKKVTKPVKTVKSKTAKKSVKTPKKSSTKTLDITIEKPAHVKAIKKVLAINGLVLLRGKHAASDEKGNVTEVGISLVPQDEQDVTLEIAVTPELADSLKVDSLYNATITKGKGVNGFTVVSLHELDNGRYDEKMVVNGDVKGHLQLNITPDQEDFFHAENDYSLELSLVEAE